MDQTNGQDLPYATPAAETAQPGESPPPSGPQEPVARGAAGSAATGDPGKRAPALWRGTRERLELILWSGGMSEEDVRRMLRGQIPAPIAAGAPDQRPCAPPPLGATAYPPIQIPPVRRVRLALDPDPMGPCATPRTALRCPLEERAERGDKAVPCHKARALHPRGMANAKGLGGILKARGRTLREHVQRQSLAAVQQAHLTPCTVVHEVMCHAAQQGELLQIGRPRPPEAAPVAAPVAAQEVDAAADARAWLQRLMDGGRLTTEDLLAMVERSVMVTEPSWLPCRDDPGRQAWAAPAPVGGRTATPARGTDREARAVVNDREARAAANDRALQVRKRCPLQIRALLGDAQVPCAQAQDQAPDALAQAQVRRAQGGQAEPLARPAKDPTDPVQIHQLLPCHLLGQVLVQGLYRHMQDLAGDPLTHTAEPPATTPTDSQAAPANGDGVSDGVSEDQPPRRKPGRPPRRDKPAPATPVEDPIGPRTRRRRSETLH